jgi:2-polyprenyl-6-hydroxyphenyl methylase/3-demethylubiquinone-9 3-methyltransferase
MPSASHRVRNALRGLLQAYGTDGIKRHMWNNEFARGQWAAPERTANDCVYPCVERFARGGAVLDLGCGEGRASYELDEQAYRRYTGVDVSDVALERAAQASATHGRSARTDFVRSDIASYAPDRSYDVILFMESIYYVPWGSIVPMLNRYATHLTGGGVFIVRLWRGSDRYMPIVKVIERNFEVVERHSCDQPRAIVLVFRRPVQEAR